MQIFYLPVVENDILAYLLLNYWWLLLLPVLTLLAKLFVVLFYFIC